MEAVKTKLAATAAAPLSHNTSDGALKEETEQYRLIVTAGPSYDPHTHSTVPVNTPSSTTISNTFLTAKIKVRVRGFHGLPSSSPPSSVYFDDPLHQRDQYSIAFSFVPKQDLECRDTVWGNDFDHPIRDKIPPLFNTAFRIVKEFIDPGLECDAYADEPWLYGPSLSCWFAFRVGEKVDGGGEGEFEAPGDEVVMREGGDGSGMEVRRELGLPENSEKRRKFFLQAANRERFVFEKGRKYEGDFYNPYLDFPNFSLKLPGFSLKVIKYVDQKSHCLRYVFKNRRTGDVYFNVNFHLLWGKQLENAIEHDRLGHTNIPVWPGGVVPLGEGELEQVSGTGETKQQSSKDDPAKDDESEKEVWYDAPETPLPATKRLADLRLEESSPRGSSDSETKSKQSFDMKDSASLNGGSPNGSPNGPKSRASRLSGDFKQLIRNVSKRENKGKRLSMIKRFSLKPDEQTET